MIFLTNIRNFCKLPFGINCSKLCSIRNVHHRWFYHMLICMCKNCLFDCTRRKFPILRFHSNDLMPAVFYRSRLMNIDMSCFSRDHCLIRSKCCRNHRSVCLGSSYQKMDRCFSHFHFLINTFFRFFTQRI